jgi:hypothetical protein
VPDHGSTTRLLATAFYFWAGQSLRRCAASQRACHYSYSNTQTDAARSDFADAGIVAITDTRADSLAYCRAAGVGAGAAAAAALERAR